MACYSEGFTCFLWVFVKLGFLPPDVFCPEELIGLAKWLIAAEDTVNPGISRLCGLLG
jgi:hypothetical protein